MKMSIPLAFWTKVIDDFRRRSVWERLALGFWLSGPFIMLWERSAADIWLTLCGLLFLVKCCFERDFSWTKHLWVRACLVFVFCCGVSGLLSKNPAHGFSEALIWVRFPLFAFASVFWFGRSRHLFHLMIALTTIGLAVMCCILMAELIIHGQRGNRLHWPYGDEMPGWYLAKAVLPAHLFLVAIAVTKKTKWGVSSACLVAASLLFSLATGERVNFISKSISSFVAALIVKPVWGLVWSYSVLAFLILAITYKLQANYIQAMFLDLLASAPWNSGTVYHAIYKSSWTLFNEFPVFGLGPDGFRLYCGDFFVNQSIRSCDNHSHNYFLQLLVETGVVGTSAGIFMVCSIIYACRQRYKSDPNDKFSRIAYLIPLFFFFPLFSAPDFFGQFSNIFVWSAISLCLVGGTRDGSVTKQC